MYGSLIHPYISCVLGRRAKQLSLSRGFPSRPLNSAPKPRKQKSLDEHEQLPADPVPERLLRMGQVVVTSSGRGGRGTQPILDTLIIFIQLIARWAQNESLVSMITGRLTRCQPCATRRVKVGDNNHLYLLPPCTPNSQPPTFIPALKPLNHSKQHSSWHVRGSPNLSPHSGAMNLPEHKGQICRLLQQ